MAYGKNLNNIYQVHGNPSVFTTVRARSDRQIHNHRNQKHKHFFNSVGKWKDDWCQLLLENVTFVTQRKKWLIVNLDIKYQKLLYLLLKKRNSQDNNEYYP